MNRRVLVTGSSRGIGKAIALELAAQGWLVALHASSSSPELEETVRQLGAHASETYVCDLSQPEGVQEFWTSVESDGELTAVVNNAGVYLPLHLLKATDEEFSSNLARTLAINFESPYRLMRAAAKSFSARGNGKILNVASRVGFRGESGASTYSASKAALINVTRALAVELAPLNVGVFGIAPGWVDTAMARSGMEERLPSILESIPLGRMASPEDCAAAASFLLSEKAAYLSGVVIDINGASYFH